MANVFVHNAKGRRVPARRLKPQYSGDANAKTAARRDGLRMRPGGNSAGETISAIFSTSRRLARVAAGSVCWCSPIRAAECARSKPGHRQLSHGESVISIALPTPPPPTREYGSGFDLSRCRPNCIGSPVTPRCLRPYYRSRTSPIETRSSEPARARRARPRLPTTLRGESASFIASAMTAFSPIARGRARPVSS